MIARSFTLQHDLGTPKQIAAALRGLADKFQASPHLLSETPPPSGSFHDGEGRQVGKWEVEEWQQATR